MNRSRTDKWSLKELASRVGGECVGEDVEVSGAAPIEVAKGGEITFVADRRYERWLDKTGASAIVVERPPSKTAGRSFLVAPNPYRTFARVLRLLYPPEVTKPLPGSAMVAPSARIAEGVVLFPLAYVGHRSQIGARSVVYPGVYVGDDCQIGEDSIIYPNVTILNRCRLGNRVVIHSGSVVGSDGFGYAVEGEVRTKIPHIGIVEIEDDVEIGAGVTIDRATMGKTWIGRGTKIDNQVQIAHNVTIGPNAVLVSQVGISGSSQIGRGAVLAGQVGVAQGMKIGERAVVGPKSGVGQDIEPGARVMGYPAFPVSVWKRSAMASKELPKLRKKVSELERRLRKLEESV